MSVMTAGAVTADHVAGSLGISRQAAKVALSKWSRAGHFARIGRGLYGIAIREVV
jgi:predicted transcriptional regulator of viral defense system